MPCRSVKTLTAKRLREVLSYDAITGLFTHKRRAPGILFGAVAGCRTARGYVQITLDYVKHRANRLAWVYMTGRWPKFEIDHADGNKSNNAWANLRDLTRAENAQNQHRPHVRNKCSGVLGVMPAARGRWRARLRANGMQIEVGTFDTIAEAGAAYVAAKQVVVLISIAADRAMKNKYDHETTMMDLNATHSNDMKLDFAKLLSFDDFNFFHDISGIFRHLHRGTGKLGNCFRPKCAIGV